jgi:hypothetical protein
MPQAQSAFSVGDVVQRVNQPKLTGMVRKARWDEQVESWNYLVQFGSELRALPDGALQKAVIV